MDKTIYICNQCNHGDCRLEVESSDSDSDIPEWCPYDQFQLTNWTKSL